MFPSICRCDVGYIRDMESNTCAENIRHVVVLENIHINMTYQKTYNDVTSRDFVGVAEEVEKGVLSTISNYEIIKGNF